jgi:predicted aspartyl protease
MRVAGVLFASAAVIQASVAAHPTPAADPGPVSFASEAGTAAVPFDDVDGLVFLPVTIGASRPLAFVLDSGAGRMVIDRAVADELGLRREGSGYVQGAGTGAVAAEYVRNVTLALPGLSSSSHELAALDLRPLEATVGRRVEGVLGYDLFARVVVEIDYAARRVTFRDPERFAYRGSGAELALDFQRRWPFVRAELVLEDGTVIEDRFLVDSGSSDAVDHPVVSQMSQRRETETGVGLGTPVRGHVGRARAFRIGGLSVEAPTVACCGGSEETSRLIGSGVLSRFRVIFDYSRRRMILEPPGAP